MPRLDEVTDEDLEREGLIDLSIDRSPVMPHRTRFDLELERQYLARRRALSENSPAITTTQKWNFGTAG